LIDVGLLRHTGLLEFFLEIMVDIALPELGAALLLFGFESGVLLLELVQELSEVGLIGGSHGNKRNTLEKNEFTADGVGRPARYTGRES